MPWQLTIRETAPGGQPAPESVKAVLDAEIEQLAQELFTQIEARIPLGQAPDPRRGGVHTRDTMRIENTSEEGTPRRTIVIGGVANLILEGTPEHPIAARSGNWLKFEWNGKTVYAKVVNHPAHPANPFVQDALTAMDVPARLQQLGPLLFRALFPKGVLGGGP
jgi:hypothetical protein